MRSIAGTQKLLVNVGGQLSLRESRGGCFRLRALPSSRAQHSAARPLFPFLPNQLPGNHDDPSNHHDLAPGPFSTSLPSFVVPGCLDRLLQRLFVDVELPPPLPLPRPSFVDLVLNSSSSSSSSAPSSTTTLPYPSSLSSRQAPSPPRRRRRRSKLTEEEASKPSRG